jgi:hypothetical protein
VNLLTSFQFELKTQFKKNHLSESPNRIALNILNTNIPRHSRKNALTVAVAGVAAATAFTATPASAALFSWCGMFIDGGKIQGTIQVDDVTGGFIALLENMTTVTNANLSPISYTTANFVNKIFLPAETNPPTPLPINGFSTYRYIFTQGLNTLEVSIPYAWFPNNFPAIGDPPVDIVNLECRTGSIGCRKDPDKLRQVSVPGPLPIFGAAAAFGFSRNFRKRIKSTSS